MNHQRFYVRHICQQGEEFQMIDEIFCLSLVSFDFKCKNRTASSGEILPVQLSLTGIFRHRRVMNRFHLGMAAEVSGHLLCILHMTFHAQGERLQTLQKQERMKRRKRSSHVPKKNRPDLRHKRCRAGGFDKADPVVAGIRLRQRREFSGGFPVEGSALHNHTSDRRAVTADELCRRVYHDVGSVLDGPDQKRSAEGVVDEFRLAIAPFFVGEEEAPRLVSAGPFPWVKDNRMTPYKVELLGDTTVMHLIPKAMNDDMVYMMMALEASRKCVPCATAYCVGAVVATAAGQFFTGYTHETGPANHAEEEAVAKALAAGADLHDAVMYSTMEPCSTRSSKLRSCTQMIIEYGFRRVVYAFKEPPCFVECHGDRLLREAGIVVDVMDSLAPEVAKINSHIIQ